MSFFCITSGAKGFVFCGDLSHADQACPLCKRPFTKEHRSYGDGHCRHCVRGLNLAVRSCPCVYIRKANTVEPMDCE